MESKDTVDKISEATHEFSNRQCTLLDDFFNKIDTWVSSSGFVETEIDKEKITNILGQTPEDLRALNEEELLVDIFYLCRYCDSLKSAYNQQKMVLEFAESSIMGLISHKLVPIQGDFTKHEVKYNIAVRADPMCSQLQKLVSISKARINKSSGRIELVEKLIEVMQQLSRRKKYG